jgi:hypothetical protein
MLPSGEGEVYQESLRNWRQLLQTRSRDPETVKKVREEIVALRKAFRKNGYDVSLGSLDIVCEGFKNEIAIREGYQRIVILIGAQEILYETGTGNHLDLWEALEQRSRRLFRAGNASIITSGTNGKGRYYTSQERIRKAKRIFIGSVIL